MNSNKLLVLLLFLIVLAPLGKADGLKLVVQPLGIVNATVAITPVEDASMRGGDGLVVSLPYALNGLSNEFVYWIANPLVEPFSASGGQITFIPGNYNYPASSNSLTSLLPYCAAKTSSRLRRGRHVFLHLAFSYYTCLESHVAYPRRRRIRNQQRTRVGEYPGIRARNNLFARDRPFCLLSSFLP